MSKVADSLRSPGGRRFFRALVRSEVAGCSTRKLQFQIDSILCPSCKPYKPYKPVVCKHAPCGKFHGPGETTGGVAKLKGRLWGGGFLTIRIVERLDIEGGPPPPTRLQRIRVAGRAVREGEMAQGLAQAKCLMSRWRTCLFAFLRSWGLLHSFCLTLSFADLSSEFGQGRGGFSRASCQDLLNINERGVTRGTFGVEMDAFQY